MQTTIQTVNALVSGLDQVKNEVRSHSQAKVVVSNDRFVQVMGVRSICLDCIRLIYDLLKLAFHC